MDKSRLALYGGPKAKTTPMGTGPRFGEEDLKYLKEAIDQNTLFYWYGNQVKQLTARFAELYGSPYCTANLLRHRRYSCGARHLRRHRRR